MQSKSKNLKKMFVFLLVMSLTVPMICYSVFASEDDSIVSVFEDAHIIADECEVHCGAGEEFEVISTFNSDRTVKVLARIQNWYLIYDYSTGTTGAVKSSDVSLIDSSGSDDVTDFEDNPSDTETSGALSDEEKLLGLVNNARSELNLSELKASTVLNKLAYYKARDIVENNNFSHNSISYGSPFEMMRANGVLFTIAGENISGNQTIDGAFYAMMNSQANKENMLNSQYTTTGIGIYTSPVYGKVIVQLFAGE